MEKGYQFNNKIEKRYFTHTIYGEKDPGNLHLQEDLNQ